MIDDRLIDDVARELTAAEPRGPFRARVLSALDCQRHTGRFNHVAPATIAAAVLLAVGMNLYVARQAARQPTAAGRAANVAAAPSPANSLLPQPRVEPSIAPSAASGPARRVRAVAPDTVALTAEELAWQARSVPPLAAPPALPLGGNQPAATVDPLLTVIPLVTEPLELMPLDDPDPLATGGA
jgi:hypothetical protein